MSALHDQQNTECPPCTPYSDSPRTPAEQERSESSTSRDLVPKAFKPFFSHSHFLKFNLPPTKAFAASVHRALLIPEILSCILESVKSEPECDHSSGERTLALLARTCRALSSPALDMLWMHLDSLDPLIKVLPHHMWAKERHPFVVRLQVWMFMDKKQWKTFHKYAVRIRSVRGSSWRIPAIVQHNVIDALARNLKVSVPLLPNLTELIWSEPEEPNLGLSVSLIKHFASSSVTTVSLSLNRWPNHLPSELSVLADLPKLCPSVTSFKVFFPRSSFGDHSSEIGAIVQQWLRLRVLHSCALSQRVMDKLTSSTTLDTLSIELNNSSTATYVGQLPSRVHALSLGGNSAALCLRYFETVQASPAEFRLRIGTNHSTPEDMEALVGVLPNQLDKTRLHRLTIELTSSYQNTPERVPYSLSPALLSSLASFPSLRELDLSTFCAAEVDDQGYKTWIAGLTGLTSLKVGVADVSKARPVASVKAVLAVLRACQQLETLWIVFDGSSSVRSQVGVGDGGVRMGGLPLTTVVEGTGCSVSLPRTIIPPLSETSLSSLNSHPPDATLAQPLHHHDERERQGSLGGAQGDENENERGVTNHRITHICVGHSHLGEDGLEALTRCLKTVMPRLERIWAESDSPEMNQRWRRVQKMLAAR